MPKHKERWLPSEKDLETVEYLSSIGLTEEQMANALGVSESTFQDAGKLNRSALRQTVLRGRAKAHSEMGKRAYEMALVDSTMMKFWLSCKMGWSKPPQQVQLSGPNGGPIQTSEESEEEKKQRVDAAIARIKQTLSE